MITIITCQRRRLFPVTLLLQREDPAAGSLANSASPSGYRSSDSRHHAPPKNASGATRLFAGAAQQRRPPTRVPEQHGKRSRGHRCS
jgi:hypothetical protein